MRWRALLFSGVALAALSGESVAQTIPGDTTGQPQWNRPLGGAPPAALSGVGTDVPYQAFTVRVTTPGAYTFDLMGASSASGTNPDPVLLIYEDGFDPTNPLANAILGDDDSGAGFDASLTTGATPGTRYTLVSTGFTNADFGTYQLAITGPAAGVLADAEIGTTALAATQFASRTFLNVLDDRVDRASGTWEMWGTTYGSRMQSPTGPGGQSGFELGVLGFMNGAETDVGNVTFGLANAITVGTFAMTDLPGTGEFIGARFGAYGGRQLKHFYTRRNLGFGFDYASTSRSYGPGTPTTGSPFVFDFYGSAEIGTVIEPRPGMRINPYIGFDSTRTVMAEYTETGGTGGALPLTLGVPSTDLSLRSLVGARFDHAFSDSLAISFDAAWGHEFRPERVVAAGPAGGPPVSTVDGRPEPVNQVVIGATVDYFAPNDRLSVTGTYSGMFALGGDGSSSHTLSVGFTIGLDRPEGRLIQLGRR